VEREAEGRWGQGKRKRRGKRAEKGMVRKPR